MTTPLPLPDDGRDSLIEFRAPKRTVWVEMPNGTGHWASNWELRQTEAKRG